MQRLAIVNGPNLNRLGTREPAIYGTTTLAQIEHRCRARAESLGLALTFQQSNHEGAVVDMIQDACDHADALVINPAGLSFHSIPVLDALKMFKGPLIELHLSNVHARDELHRHSIMSATATAVICGLGAYGYLAAVDAAHHLLGARA